MRKLKIILVTMTAIACLATVSAQERKNASKEKKVTTVKQDKFSHKIKRNEVSYASKRTKIRGERNLPQAKPITYQNQRFNFKKGKYYKNIRGRYVAVTPPRGLRVDVLPAGFIEIAIGANRYYQCQGIYYRNVPGRGQYEVVEAPVDAIVYSLPEETEKVYINGKKYYESYGVLYKVVTTPDGKAFKVVGELDSW